MGRDVRLRAGDAVPLQQPARGVTRADEPFHVRAAVAGADVARKELKNVGDRAAFDRETAVHVSFTELELRVASDLESDGAIVETQRERQTCAIAEHALAAGYVDQLKASAFDDLVQDKAEQLHRRILLARFCRLGNVSR